MPEVPISIESVILTGRYIRPDGTPLTGTLTFEPPDHLTFPDADIISTGAATVALDATGAFSVSLIATDAAGGDPSDWTYTVVERLHQVAGRTFPIALPSDTPTVDLADIAPTDPSQGEYVVITGPKGKDGTQIYSGPGAPSSVLGVAGDYYIDLTAGAVTLYGPKSGTAWPTSGVLLNGVASVNGETGIVSLSAADVGADAAGTAAALTAVGLTDWVNVKTYGAAGNGVTDDTAAIQSAINAIAATGGSVYLPAGKYLLNGSNGLSIPTSAVTLRGAGPEASRILVGPNFTGSSAITVTGANGQVMDLSVNGNSSTTTSNPAAHGITVSGARRLKVFNCQMWYLNGYAVRALATSGSSTTNPQGTQLSNLRINQCAGGIHFLGNTTQGFAVNSFVTDVHIQQGGVTTGANANADGIRIEDAWDVLLENVITWLQAGTGSAFHVIGNCAATFVKNLDALGPNSLAPNVLVEDGANGSPQNVQISGGVIQQGTVGIKVSGGSQHVHVDSLRIINNSGHGAQVDGTGVGIYFHKVFFSQSGQGAAGTNYDVNWSGTATGHILNCRFSSPIVATGTAGVQQTINVAAGQGVRVLDADFQGSGAASSNWFTAFPMVVTHLEGSNMEHVGSLDFRLPTNARVSLRPVAAGNNALAINVNGADSVDRFRLLGSGNQEFGTGSATRDTTWGRQGAAQIGTPDSDVIIGLVGKGLRIKEGTNARQGTATLVAGSVTVANTSVTATSRIQLTSQADGGTPGWLRVSNRTVGASFVITSSNSSDTSTVAYLITEPA